MGLKSPLRKKVRAILETSVPVYGNKRLHVSLVADDGSTTRKITYRRWISRKGVWWRHLREESSEEVNNNQKRKREHNLSSSTPGVEGGHNHGFAFCKKVTSLEGT
ncbi:unnamed protein product [Brassica oleracea var. botrytis]